MPSDQRFGRDCQFRSIKYVVRYARSRFCRITEKYVFCLYRIKKFQPKFREAVTVLDNNIRQLERQGHAIVLSGSERANNKHSFYSFIEIYLNNKDSSSNAYRYHLRYQINWALCVVSKKGNIISSI